jgi:hypothetical protein
MCAGILQIERLGRALRAESGHQFCCASRRVIIADGTGAPITSLAIR